MVIKKITQKTMDNLKKHIGKRVEVYYAIDDISSHIRESTILGGVEDFVCILTGPDRGPYKPTPFIGVEDYPGGRLSIAIYKIILAGTGEILYKNVLFDPKNIMPRTEKDVRELKGLSFDKKTV